jgi:quercetin dioxygenase-like cupin family protein
MKFVREDEIRVARPIAGRFTGDVWEATILEPLEEDGMRAYRFTYDPGSRSLWHIHQGEQAIFVLSGRGVLGLWGEAKGIEIGPGDWVHIQPGEKHWHGAVDDDTLVHIAVTASGKTEWYEAVSDVEYYAALAE